MKTRTLFVFTSVLFLLACNLLSPQPTAVPAVAPSETSAPPPTEAVPPSPTTASLFFRDDFNEVLAAGWIWQNENPADWNLTSARGWLEIIAGPGHIPNSDYFNLLLRLAPAGDFQLETHLNFSPVANFQFAGLIIYQSDVDFMQAGRAYCEPSDLCVGDGLYFDNYINSAFQTYNFATAYEQGADVYLRLQRQSDFYTFFASPNGTDWNEIGSQRNGLQPLLIGLVTGQNNSDPLPAQFDYFQVTGLP